MREAFFLDTADGQRFVVVSRPKSQPVGGLLYVHPFAEEMNQSRRVAAISARQFAANGWIVMQIDLAGCGDSAGDFGDASWKDWIDDISLAWGWLSEACAGLPVAIWTLRGGSLLVSDWLKKTGTVAPLMLWQPLFAGQQSLTQFLRLKAAYEMLEESQSKSVMANLRAELNAGRTVEISGYRLSPELAHGLADANLELTAEYSQPVAVLEVAPGDRLQPSPIVEAKVRKWADAGIRSRIDVVSAPSFWQIQENLTAPTLTQKSTQSLEWLLQ